MRDQGNTAPTRERVKENIYRRRDRKGRAVYEVVAKDATGKQHRRTVKGGLRDAENARDEIKRQRDRGQAIAPARLTFGAVADEWWARQSNLRPRTEDAYQWALDQHLRPRFARVRIADMDEDKIARLITDMGGAGYSAWTVRAVLTPLGRVLAFAKRQGYRSDNPIQNLERGERPVSDEKPKRILSRAEVVALIEATPKRYRLLVKTLAFSGLRISEALGLTWEDVNSKARVLHVRHQASRQGERVKVKTKSAVRDVEIPAWLVTGLLEHRAASRYSTDRDFVFASARGTAMFARNAARYGLDNGVKGAGLNVSGKPNVTAHALRHTAASLLIAQGIDPVMLSRWLGHSSPRVTLTEYAHQWEARNRQGQIAGAFDAAFSGSGMAAREDDTPLQAEVEPLSRAAS